MLQSPHILSRTLRGGAALALIAGAGMLLPGPISLAQNTDATGVAVEELAPPPSTPVPDAPATEELPTPEATVENPAPIQDNAVQPAAAEVVQPAETPVPSNPPVAPTASPEATPGQPATVMAAPVSGGPLPVVQYDARYLPTTQTFPEHDNWSVTIIPGPSNKPQDLVINGMSYQQVYESIPYRRSEYLANPGYRHETTMEVLFGQMRPTTVVKQQTPQPVVNPRPDMHRPYLMTPSDFYSYPWQYGLFPGYAPLGLPAMPGPIGPRLTY